MQAAFYIFAKLAFAVSIDGLDKTNKNHLVRCCSAHFFIKKNVVQQACDPKKAFKCCSFCQ